MIIRNKIILFLWFQFHQSIAFTARRSPPWFLNILRNRGSWDLLNDRYLIVCSSTPTNTSPLNEETKNDETTIMDPNNVHKTTMKHDMYNTKYPNNDYGFHFEDNMGASKRRIGILFRMTRPGNFPIVVLFHVS